MFRFACANQNTVSTASVHCAEAASCCASPAARTADMSIIMAAMLMAAILICLLFAMLLGGISLSILVLGLSLSILGIFRIIAPDRGTEAL